MLGSDCAIFQPRPALSGKSRNKNNIIFSFENDWKIPMTSMVGADLHVISVSDLRSKLAQYQLPEPEFVVVELFFKKRGFRTFPRRISSTVVDLRNSSTISVNVMDYLSRVMNRPYPQPKLILSLAFMGGDALPSKFLINRGCVTPFLIVRTRENLDTDVVNEIQKPFITTGDRPWVGDNKRTKRRAKNWATPLLYRDVTELEKVNYHCRRQDLWINFDEIGWDFVITPKDVNIGDCGGQCLDADNNIAHAVVKQLLQKMHPARNAGILCCQGANYKEISALYFKSKHEIVIGSMPKIIVKECRCR